ncbi:recombinase family protein [Cellulosilyticum sp. I15G10I2]|uniref:recombinase family protein n=1 Tax=Cellulosilyticum sp. I15G10I2 TaxID=1892843 RepID=UPI00085BB833|nr:recombinase family protein [Cellulosilyticum sp. I15G10I2]
MRIAIYSRKSKFTGRGDSVENQINICKNYIKNVINKDRFCCNSEEALILEDEGFSGGNTNRPQFKKLIKMIEAKEIDLVLCYRLDRISRSISDFSQLLDKLNKYSVKFVSVSEDFGDYSPMAKAMMFMTSIFSQFEREIIAERIRDNMLELAKTGRWLGGNVPLGFESQETSSIDNSGKSRKAFKLTPVESELHTIKLIYNKFLELNSLTQLESYLLNKQIQTKNGVSYSRHTLKNLLTNPVYVVADELSYNYFIECGCQVYNDTKYYNGESGIIAYNRTEQIKGRTNKLRDKKEWIISVGMHDGVIPSSDWIKVQHMVEDNKSKTFRKVKNTNSLLSGLIRCQKCGSYMRPKLGRLNKEGVQKYYYICELKEKSYGQQCNVKNVNGLEMDKMVLDQIKNMCVSNTGINSKLQMDTKKINHIENDLRLEEKSLNQNIENNKKAISNLIDTLSLTKDPNITSPILEKITHLNEENTLLEKRLNELKSTKHINELAENDLGNLVETLSSFSSSIDSLDPVSQRTHLGTLIDKIEWDGEEASVYLFGPDARKRMERLFPERDYSK